MMWDSLDNMATTGAWILIGSAIQATALLAAVGLIAWSMRRASAAVRHLLWFGAMIGLAALPVLTVFLPGWRVLPHWEMARATSDYDAAAAVESTPAPPAPVRADTSDGRADANRGRNGQPWVVGVDVDSRQQRPA